MTFACKGCVTGPTFSNLVVEATIPSDISVVVILADGSIENDQMIFLRSIKLSATGGSIVLRATGTQDALLEVKQGSIQGDLKGFKSISATSLGSKNHGVRLSIDAPNSFASAANANVTMIATSVSNMTLIGKEVVAEVESFKGAFTIVAVGGSPSVTGADATLKGGILAGSVGVGDGVVTLNATGGNATLAIKS